MKLTREQINAVTQELQINLNKKRSARIAELSQDSDIIAEATKYNEALKAIPLEYRGIGSSYSVDSFITKIVNAKVLLELPNSSEISRKVTLATIDSDNMEELMNKLEVYK